MEEDFTEEVKPKRFRFGSHIKYNFGFDADGNFQFYDEYRNDYSIIREAEYTKDERMCLKIMELNIEDVSEASLKRQYKKMVKKYHPDVNPNNKDAEEKFKILSTAYKSLLAKVK